MRGLFLFPEAVKRHPAIDEWMRHQPGDLGEIARAWFDVMRGCGHDVRETMHDDQPTACVGDAAFAYVDVFTAHVNVGFYRGAELIDPSSLLQGHGKAMRHVKLAPGIDVDATALRMLIREAYADMKERLASA
jgi:hypothetical protein